LSVFKLFEEVELYAMVVSVGAVLLREEVFRLFVSVDAFVFRPVWSEPVPFWEVSVKLGELFKLSVMFWVGR
jgi:hypothetical protein